MYTIIMEYIGKQKVPIALVVSVLLGTFAAHEWADLHFITAAKGAQNDAKMMALVEENGTLIRDHLVEYDKNELRKDIDMVMNQQYELKQFVAINGPNQLSDDREEQLAQELRRLNDVKRCMDMGGTKCR